MKSVIENIKLNHDTQHQGGHIAQGQVANPSDKVEPEVDNEEESEPEDDSNVIIGTRDKYSFTRQKFSYNKKTGEASPLEGWGFASLKVTDIFDLMHHLDSLCKAQNKTITEVKSEKDKDGKEIEVKVTRPLTGKEILIDLVQSAYDAKLRIKVKGTLPKVDAVINGTTVTKENYNLHLEEYLKNRTENNPEKLLFSIDEAYNWLPGIREVSEKKKIIAEMQNIKSMIAQFGVSDPRVQEALIKIATSMS